MEKAAAGLKYFRGQQPTSALPPASPQRIPEANGIEPSTPHSTPGVISLHTAKSWSHSLSAIASHGLDELHREKKISHLACAVCALWQHGDQTTASV